jgi:hypothetical protein
VVVCPTLAPIAYPSVHCGVCGAAEVPQRHYRSAPLSPDLTYENGEVIIFSKNGDCGVPIVDAADYRLSDLLGGDDSIFANTAVSTFSVRIEVRNRTVTSGMMKKKIKFSVYAVARVQNVEWASKDARFALYGVASY